MNKYYKYKMTQRQILIENADHIHTTDMGMERIARNLGLSDTDDPVQVCRNIVLDNDSIIRRQGKNWYCENTGVIITINSYSYTIITAHKKGRKYE